MPSPAKTTQDKASVRSDRGTKVIHSRTICRPADELYARCRDVAGLAAVSAEPLQVIARSAKRFTVVSAQSNAQIAVEIITDRPGRVIAWRSEGDTAFRHAGSIRFEPAPGDEGTEVTVTLEYEAAGGRLGGALATLTKTGPGPHVAEFLRRFKALVEAGEIPTIAGQPVGEPQKSKRP